MTPIKLYLHFFTSGLFGLIYFDISKLLIGKFISLILSGKEETTLINFGIKLKNQFYSLNLQDFEIFGPAIAPISRIKNKTRVRLLIKSNKMTKISQIEVRDWLKNISVPNNIYFSIDIDPYNFY